MGARNPLDAYDEHPERGASFRVVDARVVRLETWMQELSKKVDTIEDMVRETRDMLFELKGRQRGSSSGHAQGTSALAILRDVIMALIGAILGILGIKTVGGM